MVVRCVAAGCSNTYQYDVSFHRFPTDPHFRKIWTSKVRQTRAKWSGPSAYSMLCSDHFEPSCFDTGLYSQLGMKTKQLLKADAIPSVFVTSKKVQKKQEDRGAYAKREKNRVISEVLQQPMVKKERATSSLQSGCNLLENLPGCSNVEIVLDEEVVQALEVGCQTDPVVVLSEANTHRVQGSGIEVAVQAVPETCSVGCVYDPPVIEESVNVVQDDVVQDDII